MNERFKELEKQAITVVEGWSDERGTTRYYEFNREKFAELIVRECIDIAYEYDAPKMSGPGMIIGNRIEEHFGVEE